MVHYGLHFLSLAVHKGANGWMSEVGGEGPRWQPGLVKDETRLEIFLVKFGYHHNSSNISRKSSHVITCGWVLSMISYLMMSSHV